MDSQTLYPLPYNNLKRGRTDGPSPKKAAVLKEARKTSPGLGDCLPSQPEPTEYCGESTASTPEVVDLTSSASHDSCWDDLSRAALEATLQGDSDDFERALKESSAGGAETRRQRLQEEWELEEAIRISTAEAEERARKEREEEALLSTASEEELAVTFLPIPTDHCQPCGDSGKLATYRLVSKVNHLGSTMDSGHYTTDSFNFGANRWSSFNDSVVDEVRFSGAVVRHCF